MYVTVVNVPVVITGTNQMGWPSFASVQSGDKVRIFTETGKDGKPRPGGRPQFRITTYGRLGSNDPTPIEIVGILDHEEWDKFEDSLKAAAPVAEIQVTGVVQMAGDEPDRVKMGSKSWIAGALIVNAIGFSASKAESASVPWQRAPKPKVAVSTSLD